MDTKWKNKKHLISFLIFFTGVSLVLGSVVSLLQRRSWWRVSDFSLSFDNILQDDYQQSQQFRRYISSRLETFLAMATNSWTGNRYYYDNYGYYYDTDYFYDYLYDYDYYYDYYDNCYTDVLEDDFDRLLEETDIAWVEAVNEREPARLYGALQDSQGGYLRDGYTSLTDEEKKQLLQAYEEQYEEQIRQYNQRFHESIMADQNLLYAVIYDGKLLYTNSDLLQTDGSMNAPEGYDFLLCYENGSVRIFKSGLELDVYGDGYYREESEWFVPGYRNFQVDETAKKAVVYMAATENPILYTELSYERGGVQQPENALYQMWCNHQSRLKYLQRCIRCLEIGLLLLFLSLFMRRSRQKACSEIASFTGRIWIEIKAAILLALLSLVFVRFLVTDYGYNLLQEITYAYEYDYGMSISYYAVDLLREISPLFWLILFWGCYLAVNELRHEKGTWRHSLIRKLHETFTAHELRQPLSRRMAHRNMLAFAAAGVYVLLLLSETAVLRHQRRFEAGWFIGLMILLQTIIFFLAEYRICSKNMETARDMELLSNRIRDIRDGKYIPDIAKSSGDDNPERTDNHDLANIMAQLEDIRHGMAKAVDEQMKSERMKVELIANVSHDIKTPLTSIISYVQFLKDEESLPEHVRDYVMILDEKSQRLKNMVQDVFAVSKAASGELPMHMEELDFGKLLRQTMADMEEQIAASSLTFRTEIPDAPVMIMADGQRMYRVFQNLFQNALKYSLEGSRVYVTLKLDGNNAVASVKNTSHMELEENMDFTGRFTRGDHSRTDGGSGLGLSIAQSFTEACGGRFSLEINADLFMVTVSFIRQL